MPREEDEYTARAEVSAHAAVPPKHSTTTTDTAGAQWRRSGGKAVSAILFASMWFGESLLAPDFVSSTSNCASEVVPRWSPDVCRSSSPACGPPGGLPGKDWRGVPPARARHGAVQRKSHGREPGIPSALYCVVSMILRPWSLDMQADCVWF